MTTERMQSVVIQSTRASLVVAELMAVGVPFSCEPGPAPTSWTVSVPASRLKLLLEVHRIILERKARAVVMTTVQEGGQ